MDAASVDKVAALIYSSSEISLNLNQRREGHMPDALLSTVPQTIAQWAAGHRQNQGGCMPDNGLWPKERGGRPSYHHSE